VGLSGFTLSSALWIPCRRNARNLFIWLGQVVDGGDCTHCKLRENQRPMRLFGVLRWLLIERRRCPPPGRPLT
jgi:hypothetical protein